MILLLSPAKTMSPEKAVQGKIQLPTLGEKSGQILEALKQMTENELAKLMKVNEKIAKATYDQIHNLRYDLDGTRALYTYKGIQYKSMNPNDFTEEEQAFANQHIRILSGLYGILEPNDSIYPYRLEMQAKLPMKDYKNLYEYWKESIETYFIQLEQNMPVGTEQSYINLASKEYSRAVESFMKERPYITCTFKVRKNGVLKVESTTSKKARGAMVEYIVKERLQEAEQLKNFMKDGYRYMDELSNHREYVFLKE